MPGHALQELMLLLSESARVLCPATNGLSICQVKQADRQQCGCQERRLTSAVVCPDQTSHTQSDCRVLCAWGFQMLFDAVLANMKAQGPAGEGAGRVHPLAQRYASLASSLLVLNADAQVGHRLDQQLSCSGSSC